MAKPKFDFIINLMMLNRPSLVRYGCICIHKNSRTSARQGLNMSISQKSLNSTLLGNMISKPTTYFSTVGSTLFLSQLTPHCSTAEGTSLYYN